MRHASPCLSVSLLAIALSALCPDAAAAATGSIDFNGREWTLPGVVKTGIKRVGTFPQAGETTIGFAEGGFALVDPQGDTLTGTFESPGKSTALLSPGAESLDAYLEAKIQRVAAIEGVVVVVNAITVTKQTARAKASSAPTGIRLALGVKIQATANITVEEETLDIAMTVSLTGKGLAETPIAGTSWAVAFKAKLSLKRVGKAQGVDTLRLSFGPNAGDGIGEGECLLATGGGPLRGTFTTDGKQKATLTFPAADVEALMTALVTELAAGVATDVSTTLTSATSTVKVKHGLSAILGVKLRFNAEGDVEGVRETTTGSYALKGAGVPE